MHEQTTQPAPSGTVTHPASPHADGYESNPFTAAWNGIQRLIKTNAQTVIGVAFFNILLFIVTGVTAVAVFLAIAALIIKQNSDLNVPNYGMSDFLNSFNDSGIYLTLLIGLAICIFVASLTQSIQLNLTVAAAKGLPLKFGALLRASVGTVMPILGYISLVILALLAVVVLLAAMASLLGPIIFVVILVTVIAMIYIGLRLSYVPYCIVDKHVGPITAIKDSWAISSGHLIETIGSAAVAWLVVAIPGLVLSALARITEGAPMVSGLFSLLDMVLLVVLVIAAAMSLAERYVLIRAVSDKQLQPAPLSPFNYLAIVLMVFLAPLVGALSPQMDDNTQLTPFDSYNQDVTNPGYTDPDYTTPDIYLNEN